MLTGVDHQFVEDYLRHLRRELGEVLSEREADGVLAEIRGHFAEGLEKPHDLWKCTELARELGAPRELAGALHAYYRVRRGRSPLRRRIVDWRTVLDFSVRRRDALAFGCLLSFALGLGLTVLAATWLATDPGIVVWMWEPVRLSLVYETALWIGIGVSASAAMVFSRALASQRAVLLRLDEMFG